MFGLILIGVAVAVNIYLARKKNRSIFVWIFLSLLFNLFSTIVLLIFKPRPKGLPNRAPLVVCLFLLPIAWIFAEDSLYSKKQANKVIYALEAYRKDAGAYPANLKELVPKYLDRIPIPKLISPKWRNKFSYTRGFEFSIDGQKVKTDDPQKYCLTYPVFYLLRTTYIPSQNKWITWD
jgi:hypothetical protein